MNKFYDSLIEVLKKDERFFTTDGELLRNTVYEAAMKMDEKLIKALFNNEKTREKLFIDVDGIAVFDKVDFGWLINNRNFLPGSYTRFKNKIGIATEKGNYFSSSQNVELVFPYKDCILIGGQTKEDQKRDEIFYNRTLSPDEIDRLLNPKVLTNAVRYDKNGIQKITSFSETDNLIIKGNNLLVLSSLLERFENSIKCIFVDPPYYFKRKKPDDAFNYNSNFKLSTWLTFCKDRFMLAKKLLSKDGILTITMGTDGYAHLKVLLDEIFDVANNPSNYIGTITWRKTDNQSNIGEFSNVIDYILLYRKNPSAQLKNLPLSEKATKEYSYTDAKGKYRRSNLLDLTRGRNYYDVITPDGSLLNGPWMISEDEFIELKKSDGIHWPESGYQIPYGKTYLQDSIEKGQITSDFWDGSYGTNQRGADEIKNLFGERAFPFAKPELLIMNLLSITSEEGDIVLDFCLGSGTTCAVAAKMNRRYIGVDQMDYIETLALERMKKVINGEQGGVSQTLNWKGGGSFVYCKLAELNQKYVNLIQNSKSEEEVIDVWNQIVSSGFISCYVDPKHIDTSDEDFKTLTLYEKKQLIMDLIDANQLYINYCDINDETFGVLDEDKAFSNSFYCKE